MRSGQIRKLPRSETHSSNPKIPFTPQDDGVAFPGGITSSSQSSSSQAPYPDAPPAYTVSQATEMVGDSGGPGGHLGYAPAHEHETELKKRKVPAPPGSK